MKTRILFLCLFLASFLANAQNEGVDLKRHQFQMLEDFAKNAEIYSASFDRNTGKIDMTSPPKKTAGQNLVKEYIKNDDGTIKKVESDALFSWFPQNTYYPLYFHSYNDHSSRLYVLGNVAVSLTKLGSLNSAADVDALTAQNIGKLHYIDKKLGKKLTLDYIKSQLKAYYDAAGAEAKAAVTKAAGGVDFSTAKSFACNGFSMQMDGEKIAEYLDAKDSKTRYVYLDIKGDSLVYTIARVDASFKVDVLKRWALHIGIINTNDPYFAVAKWMNGSQEIPKINLPIVSGQKYINSEFFCSSSTKPQLVSNTDMFMMSFSDKAKAEETLAKIKELRSNIATPSGKGGSASAGKSATGYISFKNIPADSYVKIEGTSSAFRPSGSMSVSCSNHVGKKVYLSDKAGKLGKVLFTISPSLCGKYYDFKTGAVK